jgi:hypothetical protein
MEPGQGRGTFRNPFNRSPSTRDLLASLTADVRTLAHQELALARAEMREAFQDVLRIAMLLGAAAGALAIAGVWVAVAATRAFAALFAVPLWAAYALAGLALAIVGGILIAVAQQQLRRVPLLPKTKESLALLWTPTRSSESSPVRDVASATHSPRSSAARDETYGS